MNTEPGDLRPPAAAPALPWVAWRGVGEWAGGCMAIQT